MTLVYLDMPHAREILKALDMLCDHAPEARKVRDYLWDAIIDARDRAIEEVCYSDERPFTTRT